MKNTVKALLATLFVVIIIYGFKQIQRPLKQQGPSDIPYQEAHDMVHDYTPPVITRSNSTQTKNTKAIWLDLNKLLPVLKQIQKEGGDGVRIYFSKYKPNHHQRDSHGQMQDYSLQNTLVLISTHDSTDKKGNHHHYDYFENRIVSPFRKDLAFRNKKGFLVTVPQNKGELTPPGDEEGALLLH